MRPWRIQHTPYLCFHLESLKVRSLKGTSDNGLLKTYLFVRVMSHVHSWTSRSRIYFAQHPTHGTRRAVRPEDPRRPGLHSPCRSSRGCPERSSVQRTPSPAVDGTGRTNDSTKSKFGQQTTGRTPDGHRKSGRRRTCHQTSLEGHRSGRGDCKDAQSHQIPGGGQGILWHEKQLRRSSSHGAHLMYSQNMDWESEWA